MSSRSSRLLLWGLAAPLLLGLTACTDFSIEHPAEEQGRPALPGLLVLRVEPPQVELEVGEAPEEVRFRAVGEFIGGRSEDVTDRVEWSLTARRLGYLKDGATLVLTGLGGRGRVQARTGTLVRGADVRVSVKRRVVLPGAEGAGEGLFSGPAAAEAPRLVYPLDGALLPPNLGQLEIHFLRPAGQGLFEIALRSARLDVRLYTRCQPLGSGCGLRIERRLFDVIAYSNGAALSDPLTVSIRGVDERSGAVGAGAPLRLRIAPEDVRGGVYYWTSVRAVEGGSGVYRIDLERGRAEAFYTQEAAPPNHRGERGCVGCHALARGGDRMALVLGGGHISDLIQLDVASRRVTLSRIDSSPGKNGPARQFSNFQSYAPDGRSFVAALHGRLRLVSAQDGAALIAALPTGGPATHPDWSRTGALLAYTRFSDPPRPLAEDGDSYELMVQRGSLGLLRWDGRAFAGARVLVPEAAGRSSYYPSLSPDDRYVVFSRAECPERPADCTAYDNPRARVLLARVEDGAELELPRLNRPGPTDRHTALTNSWPKFGPFVQALPGGRALLWVTLSSKRDYGLRVEGKGRPQLWMAALSLPPEPGEDPSFSPFWVPGQDPETHNHIAQWTDHVVPIIH